MIVCLGYFLVLVSYTWVEDKFDAVVYKGLYMSVGKLCGITGGFTRNGVDTRFIYLSAAFRTELDAVAQLRKEGEPQRVILIHIQHTGNTYHLSLIHIYTEDIWELWQSCLNSAQGVHLADEDKEAIGALGKSLGADDINLQLSGIRLAVSYIDSKDEELAQLSSKNLRLYKSGGALIGIFAVILLF